jgi:peptide/histidine transporter 3/4
MWLTWGCVVIQGAVSIAFSAEGICTKNNNSLCKGLVIAPQFLLALGLAGFFSNILQFGMDQLHDAPSTEIVSFIVWYLWTVGFGLAFRAVFSSCFCGSVLATLFISCSVSLALCLDSCFSHWLVKEPVRRNPFKIFLGILCYAVRNKYPCQRSAFTYWEDKPYTRIYLAKDKYGGPFTTEQVEDVKIVLRIIVLLAIACFGLGFCLTLTNNYDIKVLHHLSGFEGSIVQQCGHVAMLPCDLAQNFHIFLWVFFIPFHELVIFPVFGKYELRMKSSMKFIFGLIFIILRYLSFLIIEAVGYHYSFLPQEDTMCFLSETSHSLSLSYKWYYIPQFFRGFFSFYGAWGAIEFICSQTPYALKGLIFGMLFLLVGVSLLFSELLLLPVSHTVKNWHPVVYGCGVWFYLCATAFYVIFTPVCIFVFKKVYKMRRRDEDLHNRHIFAINYYSHYIQYNEEIGTKP